MPSGQPLWPEAGLDELLEVASRKYALEFEPINVGGVQLEVLQVADMRERLDKAIADNALKDALNTLPLWAKIWPASIILGHTLRHLPAGRNQNILEVGAGCGVTGLVAAALGLGKVCISDINDDALLFARINILKNNLQHYAEVRRIDVTGDSLEQKYSLILGAEILYLDYLYRPLVKFFKRHLQSADEHAVWEPQVLLASDHRRKADPFLKKAAKEFHIDHKQVGAAARGAESDTEKPERHLICLHRLTGLKRSIPR